MNFPFLQSLFQDSWEKKPGIFSSDIKQKNI